MEHVYIRALEHFAGSEEWPKILFGVEIRDRPGPAYKQAVFSDDVVWIQLRGGLLVAKALVKIAWRGEFSRLDEIRARLANEPLDESFWTGRPRRGYAMVAELHHVRWIEPCWAGPRTYGYEWVVLENDAKRASWLEEKSPPRGGDDLLKDFLDLRARSFAGVD